METGFIPKRLEGSSKVLFPLDKKSMAYTLFQKVQGAMLNVPDFGVTCKAILDAVMDEMDAENCSLMLKDPVSGDLTIRAARGKNERKSIYYSDESGNGKRFKSGEGIAGWVLKNGQAVIVNDVNKEPHFVNVAGLNNGVNSLICFPVRGSL
jgi:Nif-specific regulatory protein